MYTTIVFPRWLKPITFNTQIILFESIIAVYEIHITVVFEINLSEYSGLLNIPELF